MAALRGAYLLQRAALDLPHPLAGDREPPPDFLDRMGAKIRSNKYLKRLIPLPPAKPPAAPSQRSMVKYLLEHKPDPNAINQKWQTPLQLLTEKWNYRPEADKMRTELVRLLVAYGAPKQEHWLDRNLAALEIPVGIGVGGVLNYLSGTVPRAPAWVRRIHFEWLHRLISQPWRWRRQRALPVFAWLALTSAVRRRLRLP